MFKYKLTLFRLLGFRVDVDASWILLAALITWTLSVGYFPAMHKGLPVALYWQMGIAGMIGLFLSLIAHELSHSLVARCFGLQIHGITLFLFGGVAELEDEPLNARTEFWMAIAGPAMSFSLSGLFWALSAIGQSLAVALPVTAVLGYLALINLVLAVFNLVPGFPLDGGRIFRAILWWWKNDLRWATKIASSVGDAFGIMLIVLGVFNVLTGNAVAGLWQALIGLFLRNAAIASYNRLVTGALLANEPVARFMTADPVCVPLHMSLLKLVEDYMMRHNHNWFPVMDDDDVHGYVNMAQVRAVPKRQWNRAGVGDICVPASNTNTVSPQTLALDALKLMNSTGNGKLLVISNGRLEGIVALSDLLKFIAIRMNLEEAG